MILSNVDFNNPLWRRFEEYLLEELRDTHQWLCNPEVTADRFRNLQGKAAFINHLLSFREMAATDLSEPPKGE